MGLSGAVGAIGPAFLRNVVMGKTDQGGLTRLPNISLWLTKFVPAGFVAKKISPDWRFFEDPCDDCQSLSASGALNQISHLLL